MSIDNEKTFFYLASIFAYILASVEMIMTGPSVIPFLLALIIHGVFRLIIFKLDDLDCEVENNNVNKSTLTETE